MKTLFSRSLVIGLFALVLTIDTSAQFQSGKTGKYQFQNMFFTKYMKDNGWVHLEGSPQSYKKSQLVLGSRESDAQSIFLCYPRGSAYHIQVHFDDDAKTWGAFTLENSFKKEGTTIFLVHENYEGEDYIVHPQRFLIQQAPEGYFIRSMDGRYLRGYLNSDKVGLTARQPSEFTEKHKDKLFMWFIIEPRAGFEYLRTQ